MSHYLAFSFHSGIDTTRRAEVFARAYRAIATRTQHVPSVVAESHDLLMLAENRSRLDVDRASGERFLFSPAKTLVSINSRQPLNDDHRARLWFGEQRVRLSDLAAPFALLGRRAPAGPFEAMIDPSGLAQLFYWQSEGICAIGSSALLIGDALGLALDVDAVGTLGLLGHFFGATSAVTNVRKLQGSESLTMSGGRLRITGGSVSASPDPVETDDELERGVSALREAVGAYLDAYPDADIELSGGIDSRLLLAAIPKSRRPRHQAVTIGSAASGDVSIAKKIAAANGMRHRIIEPDGATRLNSDELLARLRSTAERYDFATNPLDKMAIELSRSDLGDHPRLSGQNGEIARGFYYPGQSLSGGCDNTRVHRLLRWRLIGNDAVQSDLFDHAFRQKITDDLANQLREFLGQFTDWPYALDRLYLDQRMQRWCGNAVSAAYSERSILMPFFHPAYVSWALTSSPNTKGGSRLACGVINALSPDLGSLPLDSGFTPASLSRSGSRQSARRWMAFSQKALKRVGQKVMGTRRHNLGTASVTERLSGIPWQRSIDWDALRATGMFKEDTLENLSRDRVRANRATLGFLFALDGSIRQLGDSHPNFEAPGTIEYGPSQPVLSPASGSLTLDAA